MRKRRLLIEKIALIFISIIFLIVLIFTAGLVDPVVQFADPGLEAAVRDKLEKPEKPIHKSDLLAITELNASGREIRNLQGIEYLRQLVNLNLADNFIEDLIPLGSLNKLTELNLRNNEIVALEEVNFEAITGLPIRKLNLQYNIVHQFPRGEIRLEDISSLQNLTLLEELELRDNHIEDIASLSNLANLKVLNLRGNLITDISPLVSLDALEELNLRENDLSSIAPLADLKKLLYLNIHSNENIENIEPIAGLVNLKTLIMRNVPVGEQVTALRDLTNLQRLNIRNCSISDTTVIGELMAEGALQDDLETAEIATLNIGDNNLVFKDIDAYGPIREYWDNITHRQPFILPRPFSSIGPPQFSHPGGFYEDGFLLELTVDDPDVYIYYTLDGSEPCPNNKDGTVYYYKNEYPTDPGDSFGELLLRSYQTYQYRHPIAILKGRHMKDWQDCISTINLTRSSGQFEPSGDVFSGTVVRAVAYKDGFLLSEVVTNSYFVEENIKERYNVPVISLVTDEQNLFDYYSGVLVAGKIFDEWREKNPNTESNWRNPANYHQKGAEWEKAINLEFYNANHDLMLNQLSGIRTHGLSSRSLPKNSFRLCANELYGKELFDIQLFQTKETSQFKCFILRNSGNDWGSTLIRDALMHNLVRDINLDLQEYQPTVVFVNGQYWGIYNIRDRYDRFYLLNEYGVNPYNIDLLESNARVKEGDNLHYNQMLNFIAANDINKSDVYERINELMDIESFINLNVSQIFYRNTDWPHTNILFWRLRTEKYDPNALYGHDGRWRWMLSDTDFGFGRTGGEESFTHNTLEWATRNDDDGKAWSTFLLRNLLENDIFRNQFINTFADYMNTIFHPEVVIRQIDTMQNNIAPLMQENIDRWGQPSSIKEWEINVEIMRTFALNRPEYLRKHIIDYFDLRGTATLYLKVEFSKGTIIVNSIDISEFDLNKDNKSGWIGIYFQDIPIQITAIPNDGYAFSGWEEIEEKGESFKIILTEDTVLTPIFSEQ